METGGQDPREFPQTNPSGRVDNAASGLSRATDSKTTEDLIRSCSDDPRPSPFYLACFNGRPLQVRPPDNSDAHILIFTNIKLARIFSNERARTYSDELVGLSPVGAISHILYLTKADSKDPNYVNPPCGLVLDFSYAAPADALTIGPAAMSNMSSAKFARIVSQWRANQGRGS